MSVRRRLLQVSSSSSSSDDDDEGDQHFRLVKKQQVVSHKNSKASESATRILPYRASAKRPAVSPNPRQGKRGKKNEEQVPSEQISSEGEEQEDDLIEKNEDLSKSSFSKNKAQSTDTLPPFGVISSKRLSKKEQEQDINEEEAEAVVEDKSLKKDEQTVKKKAEAVVEDKSLKKDEQTVKKKNLFKRLWSEDDESTILKGLINYTAKNDTVPTSVDTRTTTTSFYDVIRNSLQMDATKNQLTSKISKLKKRYLTTLMNGGKKGDESEVFKLSKHMWGTDGNLKDLSASRVVPNSHVRRGELGESSSQKKKTKTVYGSYLKLGLGAMNGEMEEKWKKLKVKEIEVYLQQIEFLHDLATLELEELKSN